MDLEGPVVGKRPWFVSVFPPAENVHLAKDVGMIPQYMAAVAGCRSTLVCQDDGSPMPYASELTPDLELVRIPLRPEYRFAMSPDPGILDWIKKHAAQIDVLHLFHATRETVRMALAYKLRNPAGSVYLKLDANADYLRTLRVFGRGVSWKARGHNVLLHLFMALVPDLVSAETESVYEMSRRLHPQLGKRLALLPNGVDDRWLSRNCLSGFTASRKEDLAIVVGRIGSPEKNHDMLLEALDGLPNIGTWRIAFIGPVEESFRSRFESFISAHPQLQDRVHLVGPVHDRTILYDWYARAKAFCLTSHYESFCLALIDALPFGCHVVSTPISSLPDVTSNHAFGRIVHDSRELRDELRSLIEGKVNPLASFEAVREHAMKFRWSSIAGEIASRLKIHHA